MASGAFRRLKSPYVSWRSRAEGKTLLPTLPERLRGGRVEKMLDYCKTVAGDYVESVHQLRDGIRWGHMNDMIETRLANDHGRDHIFELDFQRPNGRLIDCGRPGWSSRIRALK